MSSVLERKKLLMRQTPGSSAVASPPPTSATTTTTPTPSSPLPPSLSSTFDTNALTQQYEALFNWTLKSIDEFRAQLLPVCFVSFQQTYLALQSKNPVQAADFYSLHYAAYQADHAIALHKLLAGKPLLLQQTPIKLDSEVKQILLQFLLSNNKPELLGVINEFCSFGSETVSRSPSPQPPPQTKVRLGVPKRIRISPLAEDTSEQMPDLQSSFWRNLDKILPQAVASPTPTQHEPGAVKPFPSVAMMQFAHSEGMISLATADLGRTIAAGFEDGSVRVWFGSTSQKLVAHSAPVYDVSFVGASKLLTCSGDGTVRFWQNVGGQAFRNLLQFSCLNAWCVQFAPCGYYFLVGGRDGTCKLFSLENTSSPLRVFASHNGDVDCVCWHPNLHYVFTGSTDGYVRMFDVVNSSSAAACRTFSCGKGGIDKLVCDPSGRFVSCATDKGEVFVFDISTERTLKQCKVDGEVHSMSWSPDGAFLALAMGQNQVAVFDVCDDSLFSVQQQQHLVPRMFSTNSTLSLHVNFIKPNILLAASLVERSF